MNLGQTAAPSARGQEDVPEPGSGASAGGFEVVRFQGVEDLPDQPFRSRVGLPDQFPYTEVVVAGSPAVAVLEGGGSAQQQDDQVVGPQAPEPFDRGSEVGFGLGAVHDLGVLEEGVLHLGIVGLGPGSAAVVGQRLFVAAGARAENVGADHQQIAPVAAQFQGAVDGGERLVLPVLPQQRDGQVGVTQRLVGYEVDQFPVGALGLDLALVLELGVADAVQPHLLLGRLRGRRGRSERGEEKKGGEGSRHGLRRQIAVGHRNPTTRH